MTLGGETRLQREKAHLRKRGKSAKIRDKSWIFLTGKRRSSPDAGGGGV